MKIKSVSAYQFDLSVGSGGYRISRGRTAKSYKTTIVKIEADNGLTGWGESCPMGANYLPMFPAAIAAGLPEIAPLLIGMDPRNITAINAVMDEALSGQGYIKSPVDIACWDLFGKSVGLPVYTLLGGKRADRVPVRIGIPISDDTTPFAYIERKRQEGFNRFNLKGGDNPDVDVRNGREIASILKEGETLIFDANGGWRLDDALYIIRSLRDYPVIYFEQPCASYDECLEVRRRTECRISLDECIQCYHDLLRAYRDGLADIMTFKINRMGGMTKTRLVRDTCIEMGIPVTIQDSWGGQLMDAAIAQLGHSTPSRFMIGGWCSAGHVEESYVKSGTRLIEGHLDAGKAPGLGVEMDESVLGEPIATF